MMALVTLWWPWSHSGGPDHTLVALVTPPRWHSGCLQREEVTLPCFLSAQLPGADFSHLGTEQEGMALSGPRVGLRWILGIVFSWKGSRHWIRLPMEESPPLELWRCGAWG